VAEKKKIRKGAISRLDSFGAAWLTFTYWEEGVNQIQYNKTNIS